MPRPNAFWRTPSEDVLFLTKYVIDRQRLPRHVREAAMEVRETFCESKSVPVEAFGIVLVEVLERRDEERIHWRAGVAAENLIKWLMRYVRIQRIRAMQEALAEVDPENSLSSATKPGKSSPLD
jgi:hypothetical protein